MWLRTVAKLTIFATPDPPPYVGIIAGADIIVRFGFASAMAGASDVLAFSCWCDCSGLGWWFGFRHDAYDRCKSFFAVRFAVAIIPKLFEGTA